MREKTEIEREGERGGGEEEDTEREKTEIEREGERGGEEDRERERERQTHTHTHRQRASTHNDQEPLLLDAGPDESTDREHSEKRPGPQGQVDQHQVPVERRVNLQVLVGPVVQPQPQQHAEDGGGHQLGKQGHGQG